MSSARTVKELVEPAAGEAVIAAGTFAPVGVRSTFMSVLRLARRATGAGGLSAQFQINNFIAVTESRVLLWQGNSGLGELIVEWPRGAVSGTAKRKHWVGAGEPSRRVTRSGRGRRSRLSPPPVRSFRSLPCSASPRTTKDTSTVTAR
jgi:hypothetical protein